MHNPHFEAAPTPAAPHNETTTSAIGQASYLPLFYRQFKRGGEYTTHRHLLCTPTRSTPCRSGTGINMSWGVQQPPTLLHTSHVRSSTDPASATRGNENIFVCHRVRIIPGAPISETYSWQASKPAAMLRVHRLAARHKAIVCHSHALTPVTWMDRPGHVTSVTCDRNKRLTAVATFARQMNTIYIYLMRSSITRPAR